MTHALVRGAAEFPHEKVDAAQRYLCTLKPWWNRFLNRMKVVPVNVPIPDGHTFGGVTATSHDMKLYIDRAFAMSAPLELLAGAIEYELQHHIRDSWNRMQYLSPDERRKYFNICISMEIGSTIQKDAERLKERERKMTEVLMRSSLFSLKERERWSIDEPPHVDGISWLPSMMGLPDGLSAETYYRMLKNMDSPSDQASGGDDSQQDDPNQEGDPEDSPDEPDDSDSSQSQSDESQDQDEVDPSSDPDNQGEENQESEPDSGDDDSEDSQSSDESDPEQSDPENDGEDDSESDSADDSDGESDEEASQDDDQSDSNEDNEDSDGDDSEQDQSDEGGDQQQSSSPSDQELSTPQSTSDKMDGLRNSSPALQWRATEISVDGDTPQWKQDSDDQNESPVSLGEKEEAKQELAEDIEKMGAGNSSSPFWGIGPGDTLVQWSGQESDKTKVKWTSILRRVISSSLASARMHGASDLTYAVRNPNQASLGPVLMGLTDYSPKLYVIQDVSGSMGRFMERSLDLFQSLVKSSMATYGDGATWITVDTKVHDVGKSVNVNAAVRDRWSAGFGGTVLQDTIVDVVEGKFSWKGKKYPKPDLVIIVTDCGFRWPYDDGTLPPRKPPIIICSPLQYYRSSVWTPDWVVDGKNFIYVDGD